MIDKRYLPSIVMTATRREPNYALASLRSLHGADLMFDSCPLRVFVDGDNASFLGEWERYAVCEPAPFDERGKRIFWNTTRALSSVVPDDVVGIGERPTLLLQDDVIAADNWLQKLAELILKAEKRCGSAYGLALWANYPFEDESGLVNYDPTKFYGLVSLLLTPGVRSELAPFLARRLTEDILLREDDLEVASFFAARPWVGLLLSYPSLFQHVGDVSTHDLSGMQRTSPTFAKNACDP